MSFGGAMSAPAVPALPAAPAPPPIFGAAQTPGQKPQQKSMQPTVLGGQLFANPSNTGNKTLLGQ